LASRALASSGTEALEPLPAAAPRIIRKLVSRVAEACERDPGDLTPAELHRVRILFRRLRYVCEVFAPLYKPGMRPLIERLVEFQDHLGEHQDASVVIRRLGALAEEASAGGESTPELNGAAARLTDGRRRAQEASRRRLEELWPTLPKLLRAVKKRVRRPAEPGHRVGGA
jgi:CHAD domain-containing protein